MNAIKRLFLSMGTGALCTLAGLLLEVIGGLIVWKLFTFPTGPLFAAILGGLTAYWIRQSTLWPASSTAGAVGALVAAFFCMICLDVYEPGSLEWAVKGGLYGAILGVPIGMVLGPIGLVRYAQKKKSPPENTES